MCSTEPVQKISSTVDRPTLIPDWVIDPASPLETVARCPSVNTDKIGPELGSVSPEDDVSESWEIETNASAFR